jgi:hypothetical protein
MRTTRSGSSGAPRHAFIHGADLTCWVAVAGALVAFLALPPHHPAPVLELDVDEVVALAEAG